MSTNRRRPASGRFLLRTPPGLHELLRSEASHAGMSLNELCVRRLALSPGTATGWLPASEVVFRAAAVAGSDLVGIVVFGSWARGTAGDGSDVDALIVLDPRRPITRDLYRIWDEAPVAWGGRPVEPHFVHLPASGQRAAGLWAEVAIDGVVLHARDDALALRLVQVRRDVVEGRIVRRVVHGQPYWTEVA